MPVSSGTIQKIDAKFLKLDRQFHSNTVAGTTPDCEREFAELRKAIQDARLEDANEPVAVKHAKANPTAHEHNPGGRVIEVNPITGDPVKVVEPVPVFGKAPAVLTDQAAADADHSRKLHEGIGNPSQEATPQEIRPPFFPNAFHPVDTAPDDFAVNVTDVKKG